MVKAYTSTMWLELRYDYILQACQKTCYQAALISECGCADSTYPLTGKALNIPPNMNQTNPQICSDDNKSHGEPIVQCSTVQQSPVNIEYNLLDQIKS